MALLRTPLGCLTATIVRLAMIAAVAIAGYLLIAKPLIDRADTAIKTSGVQQIGTAIEGLDRQVQRQIKQALGASGGSERRRLIRCVGRASGEASRVRRCVGGL